MGYSERRPERYVGDDLRLLMSLGEFADSNTFWMRCIRDRLCLLIRQHHLDAGLVKAYAADFCETPALRDANRDQIEAFINHLAERAAKDHDGLICQLNSYSKPTEVAQ